MGGVLGKFLDYFSKIKTHINESNVSKIKEKTEVSYELKTSVIKDSENKGVFKDKKCNTSSMNNNKIENMRKKVIFNDNETCSLLESRIFTKLKVKLEKLNFETQTIKNDAYLIAKYDNDNRYLKKL